MIRISNVSLFVFMISMISRITSIASFGTIGSFSTGLIRQTIIFDKNMPSVYLRKTSNTFDYEIPKKNSFSIEHIFPRSHLDKKDWNDMHNLVRTINDLNVNRSNYKYTDVMTSDKNWIKLNHDNYVNHKERLFIPNIVSRGIISRAILYMTKEYEYNPEKIIEKDVLLSWFYQYPPNKHEKYHNDIIQKLQNKSNVFISKYNKKAKQIAKYLEKL
jgi:hypothetical protein